MPKKKLLKRLLIAPEWEIQPKERSEDFACFVTYLRLGSHRSLAALVKANGFNPVKDYTKYHRELNRVGLVSFRWEWQARKDKFEAFIVKESLDDEIKNRKEMNKRLADHAKAAESALMTPIKKYLEKFNKNEINFDKLTDKELFLIVARATEKLTNIGEFERKVRGEPSEIIQQNNNNLNINANLNSNVENLTHEELVKKAKELGFERKL